MQLMGIKLDGVYYHVRVRGGSWVESFRIEEGPNSGQLMSGDEVRDVIGTYYDHRLDVEVDPHYVSDYIDFWQAISAPVPYHTLEIKGANGLTSHKVKVTDGGHTLGDFIAGRRRYSSLSVFFKAIGPDRRP